MFKRIFSRDTGLELSEYAVAAALVTLAAIATFHMLEIKMEIKTEDLAMTEETQQYRKDDRVYVWDVSSPFDRWIGTIDEPIGVSPTGLRVEKKPARWYYRVTVDVAGSPASLTFSQNQLRHAK